MKKFYETRLESVIQVETLIGIGHGMRMREHGHDSPAVKGGRLGVVYDFWQLIYLEEGHYDCQIEGDPPCRIHQGQLILCEPRKIRFSHESKTAVAGIISFRCHSAKMRQLKNRPLSISEEDRHMLLPLLEEGAVLLCKLPEDSDHRGAHPRETTEAYQLQGIKNRIELLLLSLYDACIHSGEVPQPAREAVNYGAKFREIEAYMQENLHKNLTLEDILSASETSLSSLKRIFHQQTNCGVIHYFLKLKIDEARRLLIEGELTVSQIADLLGFSSIHHFSNLFKKYTGVSPKQYALFGISQQV